MQLVKLALFECVCIFHPIFKSAYGISGNTLLFCDAQCVYAQKQYTGILLTLVIGLWKYYTILLL